AGMASSKRMRCALAAPIPRPSLSPRPQHGRGRRARAPSKCDRQREYAGGRVPSQLHLPGGPGVIVPALRSLGQAGAPGSACPPPPVATGARVSRTPRAPIVTVYTKADLVPSTPPDVLAVSALTGVGIDALLAALRERLPEGPFHYDPEELATQPMRFFASEFIREAAFEQ